MSEKSGALRWMNSDVLTILCGPVSFRKRAVASAFSIPRPAPAVPHIICALYIIPASLSRAI